MQILTPAEYAAFEAPPVFTSVERKRFFHLSQSVFDRLTTFRTPTNQIGFVLTRGYFLATKRFFERGAMRQKAARLPRHVSFTQLMRTIWQSSWVSCPVSLI
jgi:hypothetical protein